MTGKAFSISWTAGQMEIFPQYRGQQLGLKYVRAAITRFGIGCQLVAIKPFPLQFEGESIGSAINDCTFGFAVLALIASVIGGKSWRNSWFAICRKSSLGL
jgi:hypothetical protein